MCNQDCRTFLWGGTGVPTHDVDGGCFCVCDNDSWSSLNILGRASCVPVKAHLIFGWVGLTISVATLGHAAYHLRRQLEFHGQQTSASTSPVEQCRRQLHITAIALATLTLCYATMVLENKLRWSVVLWIVMQIPTYIAGAVLAVRMWIYTNDPRLMRKCPKVLAMSTWLETRVGHYVTYVLVSIAPVVATFLELTNHTGMTFTLIAIGICVITVMGMAAFWICGKSLMDAIDASLEKQHQMKQQKLQASSAAGPSENVANGGIQDSRKGSKGDPTLLAARKKVKRMLIFAIGAGSMFECMLLLDICSGYGVAAPLLLLVAPLVVSAPIWNGVNIQLHAGRSNACRYNSSRRQLLSSGGPTSDWWRSKPSSLPGFGNRFSRTHQHQVAPTEVPTTTPC